MPIIDSDTLGASNITSTPSVMDGESPLVPKASPVNLSVDPKTPTSPQTDDIAQLFAQVDKQYAKPSSGLDVNAPTPTISGEERQANSRYPNYNPDIDNEEYAAMNQRWYTQLAHSFIGMGARAAGTFVESWLTAPNVIGAISTGKGDGLYNSPLEESIDTWMNNVDNKYPNFVTHWEQDHPFLSYIAPSGWANAWGNNVIKNSGFMIGAMLGAVSQDALATALTGGVGGAAELSSQIGKAALWLNKVFNTTKEADGVIEGLSSATKVLDFAKLRAAAKVSEGAEKFMHGAQYAATLYTSAATEAGVEARQGYTKLRGDLIQEYKDAHNGEDPDQNTLDDIEKTATASANVRFAANLAILGISDAIQFDSIFNLAHAERKGLSDAFGIHVAGGRKITPLEGSIDQLAITQPKNIVARLWPGKEVLTGILSEGVYEEGLQNVAQEGTYNYYHNKYNGKTKGTISDILNSAIYGLKQTYGTEEGLEQVIGGALMAMVAGPITREVEYHHNKKALNAALEQLNGNVLSGTFEDKYKTLATSQQIRDDMQKAASNGNIFEYKNLKHDAFFNFIGSAIPLGRFDVRLEQLNMLKKVSDDDFATLFHLDANDENRKTASEYVDALVSKAEAIKLDYDAINRQFPNKYQTYTNPTTLEEKLSNRRFNQHNEWVASLAHYASIENDANNRIESIRQGWLNDKIDPNVTPEVASRLLRLDGIQALKQKYEGNAKLTEALSTLEENHKNGEEPNLEAYKTVLDKELDRSLHPTTISRIANEGGDINYINERKGRALDAYRFLSTPDGQDYFNRKDDIARDEEVLDNKELQTEVKYNSLANRTVQLKTGGKYYIFDQKDTLEGVPLRVGQSYTINKITDKYVTINPDNTTNVYPVPVADLKNKEIYSEEEVSKTPEGKRFINSLQNHQRYAMTITSEAIRNADNGSTFHQHIAPRTVRGVLEYNPSSNNLSFRYNDENGKARIVPVELDQFSEKFNEGFGRFQIRPIGAYYSSENAKEVSEHYAKANRVQTAKFMREALDSAIAKHQSDIKAVDEEIEKSNAQLESAKKRLQTLEDKQSKSGAVDSAEYKRLISQMKEANTRIQNIQNQINTLKDTKFQIEYAIEYLTKTKEDLDEANLQPLTNFISETSNVLKDIDAKITALQGIQTSLYKVIGALGKTAAKFVEKVSKSEPFKDFDIPELTDAIRGEKDLVNNSDAYIDKLNALVAQIEAAGEETNIPNSTREKLQEALSALEEKINGYKKQSLQSKSVLQAIYSKFNEIAQLKAKEEALQREKVYTNQLFREGRFTKSYAAENPPTNPPEEDSSKTDMEPGKKSLDILYRSTTSSANPKLDLFYNKVDHLPSRKDQRVVFVTQANEQALGLQGLTQSEWDRAIQQYPGIFKPEDIADIDKGVILALYVEEDPRTHELHYIDTDGKRIGKLGDTVDHNSIVYTHMPSTSGDWLIGGTRHRQTDESEAVKAERDSWRAERAKILSNTQLGSVYQYDVSRGFARVVPGAKNSVTATGVVDPIELSSKILVQVATNEPIVRDGRKFNIPAGRPVINNGSYFAFLNNRLLDESEQNSIFNVIKQLAQKAEDGKKAGSATDLLDKQLTEYLRGIIYWGTNDEGKTTSRNQIGVGKGTLNIGENNVEIPFIPESIEQNKEMIMSFLSKIYNTVANYKVKNLNAPYREAIVDDAGNVKWVEWQNYQSYLLSPTYSLTSRDESGLHGKTRKGSIPLTVSMDKISEDNPVNFEGRYATLQQLYETKAIKPEVKTKTKPQEKPEAPPQESNSTVPIESKSLGKLNVAYTLSEPEEFEGEEGKYVSIQFDKSKGDAKKLFDNYLKSKGSEEAATKTIVQLIATQLGKQEIVDISNAITPNEVNNIYFPLVEKEEEKAPTEQPETATKEAPAAESDGEITDEDLDEYIRRASQQGNQPNTEYRKVSNPNNIPSLEDKDWKVFQDYMKSNLPQFTSEQLNHLITMTGGGYAYGSMEQNLIKVFSGAPKGTEYHEAFEGVWKYFVIPSDRTKIYNELRSKKGEFFDILTGDNVKFSEASEQQLKEWAADRFGEYSYKQRNIRESSTLKRIFDTIIDWFKNLFTRRSEMNSLFKRIGSGYYKDFNIGPDNSIEYKSIPGLNSTVVKDINDQLTYSIINKIFSEKGSLFEPAKLTSNELYGYAKNQVTGPLYSILQGINGDQTLPLERRRAMSKGVVSKIKSIEQNWDAIVNLHKEAMKVYGIEFQDNGGLEVNDENRNYKEYDKDYYKIDNLKSASAAIKLLLSTLAVREHGEKANINDVFGEPKIVTSSIGGVNLVPFGRSFVLVMDKLSGARTTAEMMDRLLALAKDHPEFVSLYKRLGGNIQSGKIDYQNLNNNQWRLLQKFFNTFSRQQPDAGIQYTNGDQLSYTQNASKNNIVKAQLDDWMEEIKAKAADPKSLIYSVYDRKAKKGSYLVAKDRLPKEVQSASGEKEVAFLNALGITSIKMDMVKAMSSDEFSEFSGAVKTIADKLATQPDAGVPVITSKVLNLGGAFNKLARAYLGAILKEPSSVFFDNNSEYRNEYVLHNRISVFASAFNDIRNVNTDLPILLPHVADDVFSAHSVVLHGRESLFFGPNGNRKEGTEPLRAGYIMGSQDNESGRSTDISNMTYDKRRQIEFNQNLNGKYYFINSVDSSTEHLINFGNYIRWGNLNINSEEAAITNDVYLTFAGYLSDELALIKDANTREKNSETLRSAKGTDRAADKLRFVGQILSESKDGQKFLKKFYSLPLEERDGILENDDNNKALFKSALKEYFHNRTVETFNDFVDSGIIVPSIDGATAIWKGLDENHNINYSNGANLNDVLDLIAWREANFAINNIEMHKLILGDPFERKAKDEIKRVKLQISPRQTTYSEPEYDTWASTNRNITNNATQLKPGELGYVYYKDHVNTTTVSDIQAISVNSLNKTPDSELNAIYELYEAIDETDSGAWGSLAFHKQFAEKTGDWSDSDEKFAQDDHAWARYELSKKELYKYTDSTLEVEDKAVADRLNSQTHNEEFVTHLLKPIATGPKSNVDYIGTVSDKYSIFPLTWQLARRYPNLENLYLRMFNSKRDDGSPIDYVICKSGRKVGADHIDTLYDPETGKLSMDNFRGDIRIGYDTIGIITPVDYHEEGNVTQGTQITNLATIDLMQSGVPRDVTDLTPGAWENLSEQEKKDKSPLYGKIARYNSVLKNRVDTGFQHLLNKWGIDDNMQITDKNVIAKLLQNEIFRRELPDNIKDSIRVENGEFVYPLETTNSQREIMGILMSQIDKAFISRKINGQAAVQIPVTGFEKSNRKFAYKAPDGSWKILGEPGNKSYNELNATQKKKLVAVADTYKFYEPTFDKDGKITSVGRCEIGLTSKHIRAKLPRSLNEKTDAELITYLNKNPELLQGVAFRIPTSGLNLTEAFHIKEFLPDIYGDTVVVPSEITKKTGSDFDIDKLNIYLKNIYADENGDIHPVKLFSSRGESDAFYGDVFDKKLSKSIAENLEQGKRVADRLTLLQSEGLLDNYELFTRNQKYLNTVLENTTDDEDIDDAIEYLSSQLDTLDAKGAELNDEAIQKVLKDKFLEDMYMKALDNELIQSTEDLILDPSNFKRLITPNDAEKLVAVRKELNESLGINNKVSAPLLNSTYLAKHRHNNLIGKTRVGVYSLSQVYNTVMQGQPSTFDPTMVMNNDSYPEYVKSIVSQGSKVKHNTILTADGRALTNFGAIYDVDHNFISDTINPLISGAVDMPSDQSLSEVGFVEQRGPVGMAMVRAGIPLNTTVWLLNQPIVRDYIQSLNRAGRTNLLNPGLIQGQIEKFGSASANTLDENKLKANIIKYYKNKKDFNGSDNAQQVTAFKEFIYYAVCAQELFTYNMGLNYDRANFSDPSLIADKDESTIRATSEGAITGAQQVLHNTFIGKIQDNLQLSRDALGSFIKTEHPDYRGYIDAVATEFSKPGMFVSLKNKVAIAKSVRSSFIDFLIQASGLNNDLSDIMINPKTAVANKLQAIKKDNPKAYNTLSRNLVMQGLQVLTDRTNRGVINLKFDKKNMDMNQKNLLTEAFRELRENTYIKQNNLYDDIVKLAILQSGTENSPISFSQFIPVEDFSKVLSPVTSEFSEEDLSLFVDHGMFFRNNWWKSDIVPTVKVNKVYDPVLKQQGIKRLMQVPYGNVPTELKAWAETQNNGKLIALTDKYNSRQTKFPFVKIAVPDPALSEAEFKALKNAKDLSRYSYELYQQVMDDEGFPLVHTEPNSDTKKYIYKQVNAWGMRYKAREYYTYPRPSEINNGTVKVENEFDNHDIVGKYSELYSNQTRFQTGNISSTLEEGNTNVPDFNQDPTEGTDNSCPF